MGKKFSDLERASSLNNGDLFAVAQVDAQAQTGYKSKSTETSTVAQKLLKGIEFPTDLETDDKTVLGAINEVNSRTIAFDVVSGPVANFKTSLELPLKSLEVDVNAVQDLHGYDNPWVGGAGKNQFKITATSQTINGVTFTINDNGTVTINGTATGENARLDLGLYTFKANTSVIINGLPDSVTTNEDVILGYQGYGTVNVRTRELSITRSSESDWENLVYIGVYEGKSVNNLTFSPMIRFSSVTDATYEPYENICPISGWNEISLVHCGKNLFPYNSVAVYTYNFSQRPNLSNAINKVYIKHGKTYTLSIDSGNKLYRMRFWDANGNIITNPNSHITLISGSSNGITYYSSYKFCGFISPANANNICQISSDIDIWWDFVTQSAASTLNQLEVGSSASTYEPYNGNTEVINLGGTYYGGHFTQDKAGHRQFEVTSRIASYTGESGEAWMMFTVSQGNLFRIQASDRKDGYITESNCKCNSYKPVLQAQRTNETVSGTGLMLDFINNNFSSVEDWKTNLADNPIQIVYELAIPYTIDLTDGEPISTLLGTNNIYADSGDASAEYALTIKDYIDKEIASVQALILNS